MPLAANQLYEFGPYRIDPARNLLLRDAKPVPLTAKAFETLLVLVELRDQVVSKDELMRRVWPDTFVEESNLMQHISMLRRALGESAQDPRYIVTLPGRGYRFTEQIRIIPENGNTPAVVSASHDLSIIENESAAVIRLPLPAPALEASKRSRATRLSRVLPAAIGLALLAAAAFRLRPVVPAPSVIAVRQLTHAGNVVINMNLATDGPRVYFMVNEKDGPQLRYVSADGGEVMPLRTPFPYTEIMDISPNGTELLAQGFIERESVPAPGRRLWRVPLPDGSPRQIADLRADAAAWSKDGRNIAYDLENDSSLNVADSDGSQRRKIATFAGMPYRIRWSPDGKRIRLSVFDQRTDQAALWETDVASGASRLLLAASRDAPKVYAGRWSEDGRYYFFIKRNGETRNIWVMREQRDLWHSSSDRPTQLTVGPVSFSEPVPSRDGKSLFAIGLQVRGQLMRYNQRSYQFEPFAGGPSAYQVAFSPDGQFMAYIEVPSGNLMRARTDGSDPRQLTFGPRAFYPRWSPDGTLLAFLTSAGSEDSQVYLVPAAGGTPEPVIAGLTRQDMGSWSTDGTALLMSGRNQAHPDGALFWVNLKTKQLQFLPETDGLYRAILSPDQRYIATCTEALGLVLYDTRRQTTTPVSQYANAASWSSDGNLYFDGYKGGPLEQGLYRLNPLDGNVVRLPSPDFPIGVFWGPRFSLAPDGSIIMMKDVSTRDIYALDLQLP